MKTTTFGTVAALVTALVVLSVSVPAGAAVISPVNGSFELPAFDPGTKYISAVPDSWQATSAANTQILHHPANSPYLYPTPADGITLYGLEAGPPGSYLTGIQQDLGTMTEGESYTFDATLYSNSESLLSYYRISFYNVTDGHELKAITQADFDPSAGGILQTMPASFTYTAVPADDGDQVRLILEPAPQSGRHVRTGIDAVTVTSTFEPPGLAHQWTFEDGTARDSIGSADGTLNNGAAVVDLGGSQGLQLDGMNDYMRTSPVDNTIGEKTLIAWVRLDNLAQQSGGVLTLENPTGLDVFDSIVYGERTANQWMNGSNGWSRSDGKDNGGALEESLGKMMLAIAYGPGGAIDIYRDGQLYASYYTTGGPISYPGGVADVLLGLRHLDAIGQTGATPAGNDAYWAGWIEEARIYNRALTPAEVLYLYDQGPAVPEPSTAVLLACGGLAMMGLLGARRRASRKRGR